MECNGEASEDEEEDDEERRDWLRGNAERLKDRVELGYPLERENEHEPVDERVESQDSICHLREQVARRVQVKNSQRERIHLFKESVFISSKRAYSSLQRERINL
jgi:hypothetical protein